MYAKNHGGGHKHLTGNEISSPGSCGGVKMSRGPIVPCPVRLGSVKSGGLAAHLHQFTLERNLQKVEKLLRQGETLRDSHTQAGVLHSLNA